MKDNPINRPEHHSSANQMNDKASSRAYEEVHASLTKAMRESRFKSGKGVTGPNLSGDSSQLAVASLLHPAAPSKAVEGAQVGPTVPFTGRSLPDPDTAPHQDSSSPRRTQKP